MTAPASVREAPVANAWHALTSEDCVARLHADAAAGLTVAEAASRLAKCGPNALPEAPGRTRLALFLDQFKSILVGLLVVAGGVMLAMGELVDASAILAILALNAVLGYVQEVRAADALAALRRMAAPNARVRRGGAIAVVPAVELVPGDVVVLAAGDRIPADVRLVRTFGFRTVEAALTGESEAVEKDAEAIAPEAATVADRRGMAWTGTIAVAGDAEAVVVATGRTTEFGRIAAMVRGAEEQETPLQVRLRTFGKALTIACGAVCVLVFTLGVIRGLPILDMLLAAVSLAVAAVPEGLPAVVTIALALGVAKMAKRNALIRRLPAVETLGSTSVICADKTGTLTVGEMTVRSVASLDYEAKVEGDGYGPRGAILATGAEDAVRAVLHATVAGSTARIVEKDGEYTIAGDPTEGALVVAAGKAKISVDDLERDEPIVGSLPFDSVRKRMSITRRVAGGIRSYVKGAPESVLPLCVSFARATGTTALTDEHRASFLALNRRLASQGLRVLAVACRDASSADAAAEEDLTILGLVGMHDLPRPSAKQAVEAARAAGIRTVMITGDQPATAFAIARDLGIAKDDSEVMAGPELEKTDDATLRDRVESVSVYARVSPEHKLRIVKAWKSRGAVVAMTGDGVNDAPALKGADIGVAMGKSGTDVAKDASAMVVTDDDFASIVAAVEEGRRIFENIRKTLLYLLSGNLAEILVMAMAVVAGWPLPLLPIQLLWINLVTDGLPALALATILADPDVLRKPPRPADTEIADRGFLLQMATIGLLDMTVTLAGFLYGLKVEGSLDRARTYAFSILVIAETLRALAARSRTRTLWEIGALSNSRLFAVVAVTLLVQLWSHHSGALEDFLHTGELSWTVCGIVFALGAVPVTVLEVMKLVRRGLTRRSGIVAHA